MSQQSPTRRPGTGPVPGTSALTYPRAAAISALTLGAIAASAALAPTADAGQFVHRYCNGTTTQNGWAVYATGPGTTTQGACALQARLVAGDGSNTMWGPGSVASIRWEAPDNTSIVQWNPDILYGYSRWSADTGDMVLRVGDTGGSPAYSCKNDECARNIRGPLGVFPGATVVQASITCTPASFQNCRSGASLLDNGGTVVLNDPSLPTGGTPTGNLLDGASPRTPLRGEATIALGVDDQGSGVATTTLNIDGTATSTSANSDCEAQPAFRKVPCSLHYDGRMNVDTSKLPDGEHSYEVVATDASGNNASLRSGKFYVANSPVGPGSPEVLRGGLTAPAGTDTAKLTASFPATRYRAPKACKSKSYRRRHKVRCTSRGATNTYKGTWSAKTSSTLTGRLTNTTTKGTIAGAPLTITGVVDRGNAAPIELAATTNENGRFTVALPKSAGTRKWIVRYRAREYDAVSAANAGAQTVIRAKSRLYVSRRTVRPGARLRFTGRLADRTPGVPVVLQVHYRGKWRVFETTSSLDGGTFSASYRFSRRGSQGTYRFRARVRPTGGTNYSNVAGYSNNRTVRVR